MNLKSEKVANKDLIKILGLISNCQKFYSSIKKNKKKDPEIREITVEFSQVQPKEDFMGKKKAPKGGEMDTESEDFHKLTAISALEGGDDQARADVAQSVYNRVADGTYGANISEVLTADGQYQPAYTDPTASTGKGTKTAPEFKEIKDKKNAE